MLIAQLRSICLYYSSRRVGLGEELENEVQQMLDSICDNPWLYPIVYKDVHRALLSRFKQHIYYVVENDAVVVVEFRDARREPPKYHG